MTNTGYLSREDIKHDISSICREILRVDKLEYDQEIFILGYDQILGSRLLKKINDRYGIEIDSSVLRDALTVAKLADLVQMKQGAVEYECLVPMRTEGTLPPLYLIHGVGGNVLGFFDLARKFSPDQPVYGVQAQSLYSPGRVLIRLTDMASCYLKEIRRLQPKGPYHFVGLSFGGLIAYEMAQQLRAEGEEIGLLGFLDTWHPTLSRSFNARGGIPARNGALPLVLLAYSNTKKLSFSSKMAYLWIRLKTRAMRIYYHYSAATGKANITDLMTSVREINSVAGLYYETKPYPGEIHLFRADAEYSEDLPTDLGWRQLALGGITIHHFPEDHGRVLAEPGVTQLAETIATYLAGNQGRGNAAGLSISNSPDAHALQAKSRSFDGDGSAHNGIGHDEIEI